VLAVRRSSARPETRDELLAALNLDGPVIADVEASPADAVRRLATTLDRHEVGVVRVLPGRGPQVRRALAASPLTASGMFLALPDAHAPRRLLACDPEVLGFSLDATRPSRRAARAVLRRVPASLAADLLPTLVTLRRRDAGDDRRLPDLVPGCAPHRLMVVRSRAVIVAVWPVRGRTPLAFLKLGSVGAEAALLARLADAARRAGAAVPRVLGQDRAALALSVVPGTAAAPLLGARPQRREEVTRAVDAWLRRWHECAAQPRALTTVDVERLLLGPVRRLAGTVASSYSNWLAARAAPLVGRAIPLAPAHQDLTMANVLLDGGRLGIVDWETAADEALPFVDLPYAVADAVTASERYADRVGAFERCFGRRDGSEAHLARELLGAASRVAGADAVALAFHACWLSHAANDLERAGPGAPFVAIAAAIAADPDRYDPCST
jgi:hypothetical protein